MHGVGKSVSDKRLLYGLRRANDNGLFNFFFFLAWPALLGQISILLLQRGLLPPLLLYEVIIIH